VDRPYDIRRAITSGVRRLAPLIALAVLGLALAPGAAPRAAPTIDIKAQTQLRLERVRLVDEGTVEVTGTLTDRLTGEGIDGQRVVVRIGADDNPARQTAPTRDGGKFSVTLRNVEPGPQPIVLEFGGVGLLERADPFETNTDPARAPVALVLESQEAPGGARLTVSATVDGEPAELPIQLSYGPPGGALKRLADTRTGVPVLFTRAIAGGPGTQRIRASFAGDGGRQAATAETTLELGAATKTTMQVSATSLAFEDDLVLTGVVTDEEGKPIPRAAVTLSTGDRRLAQGATGEGGAYRFEVEAELFGQGQFGVKVRAEPSNTALRPSDSPPAIIKIAPPQPVPVSYTIAAFIATALAAGGFFTARAKPWQRFRRPAPPAEAAANAGDAEQEGGGLVVNKPGLVSTLRRASDDGFSGAVRDTVRGRPVADAVVRLVLGDVEREVRTTADGSFTIERLAPGEHRAEVAAPGHVTERFAVSIPHRGELRGVRIDLVPVRERVFQLYRRAAEPVLPEPRLWGIWSPRQVVDHVRAQRPTPALAVLTDFVEEVYFSPRLATETILAQAAERVDLAIRERAHAAPAVPAPAPAADRGRPGTSA
jgi:Carboxypeptidase regulatory-like domain